MVRTISLATLVCLGLGLAASPSSADQAVSKPAPEQAGSGTTPGPQGAPNAEAAHIIDVKCASVSAAAVSSARKAPSAAEENDDDALVQLTRARAQVSGAVLGMPMDQVNKDIDEGAAKILRNLTKTEVPAELKQEQLDLGRVLIECAVLQTKK